MLQEVKMTDEEKTAMYMKCLKKELVEKLIQCNKILNSRFGSNYFIGADPFDKFCWWQSLLKKTGLFYKDRPGSSYGIFYCGGSDVDGAVEYIEEQRDKMIHNYLAIGTDTHRLRGLKFYFAAKDLEHNSHCTEYHCEKKVINKMLYE